MSWSTKAEAVKAGKKALKAMTTSKWKIRVWENRGWHVSLIRKFMNLSITHYGGESALVYSVLVSCDALYPGTGETYWSDDSRQYDDPNKAVEGAIKQVRAFVKRANKCLKEIESN